MRFTTGPFMDVGLVDIVCPLTLTEILLIVSLPLSLKILTCTTLSVLGTEETHVEFLSIWKRKLGLTAA